MLSPKSNWFWYIQQQKLCISLGDDLEFVTAFSLPMLLNTPQEPALFSLENSECYLTLADRLLSSDLSRSPAQQTQILLNATAALTFHKPLSPKSWFFCAQDTFGTHKQLGFLENEYGSALVLAISEEYGAVTCMLLSDSLQLNQHKSLAQFQLIKVMANRLIPFIAEIPSRKTA
ncbi:MAG: cell division protein ZapC [Paraglaciecola sp.]|jgi:cell division protein ZapC